MTRRSCMASVVLALLLAGCGGDSYQIAPVSGRITLDSKPLANAAVIFVPAAGAEVKNRSPSSIGTTDADGRYSLVLDNESEMTGAVLGKHKVKITIGAQADSNDTKRTFHRQLPAKYNRKTELECEVPAGGRTDANFDLKSSR